MVSSSNSQPKWFLIRWRYWRSKAEPLCEDGRRPDCLGIRHCRHVGDQRDFHGTELNVPVKVPVRQVLCVDTLLLRPLSSIRQRAKLAETVQHKEHIHRRNLNPPYLSQVPRKQVKHGARAEDSKVQGGKVVVEEELSLHQEEGEVV
jgi:hypothetical protein